MKNVFNGMAPIEGKESIARTQLYFIDCGRRRARDASEAFSLSSTAVYDEYRPGPDDRNAVIIYAAAPGEPALALQNDRTLFSLALLDCLSGYAAVRLPAGDHSWGVTVNSLINALQNYKFQFTQEVKIAPVVGGLVRDAVIRYLPTPQVDVTIEVESRGQTSEISVTLDDAKGMTFRVEKVATEPLRFSLQAGLYIVTAQGTDAEGRKSEARLIAAIDPPESLIKLILP